MYIAPFLSNLAENLGRKIALPAEKFTPIFSSVCSNLVLETTVIFSYCITPDGAAAHSGRAREVNG